MERARMKNLMTWKKGKRRNPLILYGPAHTGKTRLVTDFGEKHYGSTFLWNFFNNKKLSDIFRKNRDPESIIHGLEKLSGREIAAEGSLLIFDEIENCPEAVNSLDAFAESTPQYDIIATSSLLPLAIGGERFNFPENALTLKLFPMSFKEFLWAAGQKKLVDEIENSWRFHYPMFGQLHETALSLCRAYMSCGGMPACVEACLRKEAPETLKALQKDILASWEDDMARYATPYKTFRTMAVFESMPGQLKKENKKFMYTLLQEGGRSKSYEFSMNWLKKAGFVIQSGKVKEGTLPLTAHRDPQSLKLYNADVGLLTAAGSWDADALLADSLESGETKKAVLENYVAQELTCNGYTPWYWESEGKADIDFVIQRADAVIPIEIRAGKSAKGKSFSVFLNKYHLDYGIEISERNFSLEGNIRHIPVYAVFCI